MLLLWVHGHVDGLLIQFIVDTTISIEMENKIKMEKTAF